MRMYSNIANQPVYGRRLSAMRFQYYLFVLFAAMLLLSTICIADESKPKEPIRFGLLPILTKATLVRKFNPLFHYLEQTMKRPVEVRSAPNFRVFIERAINGEYDMFIAAPQISAYMEQEHQSQRISRFSRDLKGYFVVHKDAPYKTLADLRGKRFAYPDPLAIITLLGEQTLLEAGLDPDRDFTRHYTTHNNAMRLVARGEQDIAVVGITIFDNMPEVIKKDLRVLESTAVVPHLMFHARKDLAKEDVTKISAAMLAFTKDGAGKEFFNRVAFGDMAAITDQHINQMEKLVDLLKKKLDTQ
jgi:phosphonate transport system substrate-binding protein